MSLVARNARARNRSSPTVAPLSNVPLIAVGSPWNGWAELSTFLGQSPSAIDVIGCWPRPWLPRVPDTRCRVAGQKSPRRLDRRPAKRAVVSDDMIVIQTIETTRFRDVRLFVIGIRREFAQRSHMGQAAVVGPAVELCGVLELLTALAIDGKERTVQVGE